MYGSLARKPERCKVVVRNLPPALTQKDFMDALSQFSEQYDWTSFVPGKVSTKRTRPACCYVHFKTHADVLAFKTAFAKRTFADGGKQQPCVVEYAPSQKVPPSRTKRDPRENTIDTGVLCALTDADYVAFLADLEKEREALPSAEVQLERQAAEAAGAADEGNGPIITPLMQFLAEKHALKAPAAKAAGKASPGRGASGQRKGAARLRTTSLAPVAEAEESAPVAAAAPAAAPNAHAGRRKEASKPDPQSAAKAAAMRALSKAADDAELGAPQKPAKVAARPAPASPDPKVRPGYGAWAPKTFGRLAVEPSQPAAPPAAAASETAPANDTAAPANDTAAADKAAAVKQARAAASKAATAKVQVVKRRGGGGGKTAKDADPG